MKKLAIAIGGVLTGGLVQADDLAGVDEMLCAAVQVQVCIENDTCYSVAAAALDVPDFVVIDLDRNTVSTTRASNENRSTAFSSVAKSDGKIYLQGIEEGRAFSFVIDEATGRLTVAVSRDGLSVTVFGVCTDADIG